MRELIVVFNGNEMSLGILLATWLFWTALGGSLSSALRVGKRNPNRTTAILECLLATSLPPTIWALRVSKSYLQSVPGELVGPLPMLLVSLGCLCLFCAISGALFVVGARMVEFECKASLRMAATSAYLFEAAGSALGGIVASIVFLPFLEAFQIAAILALCNLCMAVTLWLRMRRKRIVALVGFATLIAIPLLLFVAPRLNNLSQARLWRGFRLLESRDTIFGNLAVTETGTLRSIYDNGVILANVPDENAAEEAVHYALLEHPEPRNVLLIGGGVNGSVAQALKHPSIARIDYVELDPALIDMARQFFPEQSALNADSRVQIHYADGRRYLKAAGGTFDVIILDVPDPQTAQLNRFYTEEFFTSARDHLAPGGLLALELRSAEETISPDLGEFLRCIQRTLNEVFPNVAVIPGETIHLFGAVRSDVLTTDPGTLMARLRERHIHTEYVREYFIPYRMMPDRMEQVQEQLQPTASTPVNRDFAPIAYYFDVVLWGTQFKSGYATWFRAAAHIPFRGILFTVVVVLSLVAALSMFAPTPESRPRSAAAYCTAASGFTLMALQIFILLAFQSIYGYVYHQLAILIGLSMAGIALGSWLGMRQIQSCGHSPCRRMAETQFLLCISGPLFLFAVSLLARVSGAAIIWIAAQLLFPALAALSGILGGYQFPIASEIYFYEGNGKAGLGTLYAIDLLGGCGGALVLSSYMIPVFGFWKTAWLCVAINFVPALVALQASLHIRRVQT
jgi:spermidine synthase